MICDDIMPYLSYIYIYIFTSANKNSIRFKHFRDIFCACGMSMRPQDQQIFSHRGRGQNATTLHCTLPCIHMTRVYKDCVGLALKVTLDKANMTYTMTNIIFRNISFNVTFILICMNVLLSTIISIITPRALQNVIPFRTKCPGHF